MTIHSRKLSFTTPILMSFSGILVSFILIASAVILSQRKDILDDYHKTNRNFTHNLAALYTASVLRENEYMLDRAAALLSHNDELNNTVNLDRKKGLQLLMHLLVLMPSVSAISVADVDGNYLRAPEIRTIPNEPLIDVKSRPWFSHQAESSMFNHYTSTYTDLFTHRPSISLYKPVISPKGNLIGSLAFHLDLVSMGYTLRQMKAPVQGEFFVVDRRGWTLLHPDTGAMFRQSIRVELMESMTSGEGSIYDRENRAWYYYYAFTNPEWFVIYKVSDTTLNDLTRHETLIVGWGFGMAAVVIVLFGLYLRHSSRNVLMNIINAIKTGDVKQAPKLEAMLSNAIRNSKEREQSWQRQATIDALTGCRNRGSFDKDLTALINQGQPFALSLIDIDNFKSINDTWGHLNGDIVLRNVAREGIQVMQPHAISVYRYGGEEFAVLFDESLMAQAESLLNDWRLNVIRREWREENLHVTFSGGLGEWRMESSEQLIAAVDQALYQAKQEGKNRILIASPR